MKQAFVPYETREGGIKFLSSITQANHPTLESGARAIVARFKLVDMWKVRLKLLKLAIHLKRLKLWLKWLHGVLNTSYNARWKISHAVGTIVEFLIWFPSWRFLSSIGLGYRDVKDNIVLILNKLLTSDAQLRENVIWPCLQLKFFSNGTNWSFVFVQILIIHVSVDQKTSVLSLEEFLQFCKPRETSLRNFTWRVEIVEKVSQMCGLVFSEGFFTNLRNGQAEYATEPIKMFYLISLEPGLLVMMYLVIYCILTIIVSY